MPLFFASPLQLSSLYLCFVCSSCQLAEPHHRLRLQVAPQRQHPSARRFVYARQLRALLFRAAHVAIIVAALGRASHIDRINLVCAWTSNLVWWCSDGHNIGSYDANFATQYLLDFESWFVFLFITMLSEFTFNSNDLKTGVSVSATQSVVLLGADGTPKPYVMQRVPQSSTAFSGSDTSIIGQNTAGATGGRLLRYFVQSAHFSVTSLNFLVFSFPFP